MTKLISAALVSFSLLVGAPALAEPEAKTELIGKNGQPVQVLPLHYDFNAVWVIDTQRVLYRDDSRQHYLVTLKEPCSVLAIKGRGFAFFPDPEWRLQKTRSYEVRSPAGKPCDVAQVAKIEASVATPLRKSSLRRVW